MPTEPAAARSAVAAIHNETDSGYAAVARKTVNGYRNDMRSHLRTLLQDRELRIRLKTSDLVRWLEDGQRLTFHRTGLTNGLNDIEARRSVEHEMMGVPLQADEDERPRYGYLSGSRESGSVLCDYGNVLVRLRDEIRDRVTVVLGDSLGSSTPNPQIPGGWICMVAERLGQTDDLLCRFPDRDVASADHLHDACDESYEYAEVQIYDQLDPRSIRQIVYCDGESATDQVRILTSRWGIDLDEIDHFLE
jgi:hypothetical protein